MELIFYHLFVFLNGLIYFLLVSLGILVFSFIALYIIMGTTYYIEIFFKKHPKAHGIYNKIESVLSIIAIIIIAIFIIYCIGLSALGINKISG